MKNKKIKVIMVTTIMVLSLVTGSMVTGLAHSHPIEHPAFITQPNSQSVFAGQDVVFSIAIGGSPAPALQWQVSLDGGLTWTDIEGQIGTALLLSTVNLTQNGSMFRCVATSEEYEVTSSTVTLFVNSITNAQRPAIINQPGNSSALVNGSITLSVTAEVSDNGTLSYQWFSSTTDRNTGGTLINGATSRTFTPPTASEGTTYYYVVVTNTNSNVSGTATVSTVSSTARVDINPPSNARTPVITNQPEAETVLINDRVTLFVTAQAEDNGTLSYQWFKYETADNAGGTPVSGATGNVFVPPTDTVGVTYYYVIVTNTNSTASGARTAVVASRAVPVTVITTPDAPSNLNTVVNGNQVTLSWDAPENNGGSEITGYQVSDNVITFWIDANGRNEHTFGDLTNGREYTFNVRAVNEAGAGEEASLNATTTEKEIINVNSVYLSRRTLDMLTGNSIALTVVVTPWNADDTSVVWSSDDTSVATVDANGVVTALSPGTAVITATTNDGNFSASCTVTVMEAAVNGNPLLWVGLGALAPIGTGTGIYFWRKKK